jgi:uncharacterized protein (DUF2267 family)
MTPHITHHPFDQLLQTANVWLAEIRTEFDTDDSEFAFRVTRAWLHALRDQLPIAESVHFAAQLPEVLRGIYYEGWQPTEVPRRCRAEQFSRDVAASARITRAEVPRVLGAVSAVMDRRLATFDKVLASVPLDIRVIFGP